MTNYSNTTYSHLEINNHFHTQQSPQNYIFVLHSTWNKMSPEHKILPERHVDVHTIAKCALVMLIMAPTTGHKD